MMHVNNSHAPPADMAQIAKDAGANKYLIEQAKAYRCPLCAAEARAGARRHAALPLRARYFNAVVMLDHGLLILERPGEGQLKLLCLGMIDSFSMFSRVFVVPNGSSAAAYAAAQRGWIEPYGAPRRIFHDSAATFTSKEWGTLWGRNGTLVTCSAAEAPWQHGKIEIFWRIFKRAARIAWREFASFPNVTPEEVIASVNQSRNDLSRTSAGISPSELVFGITPK